MLVEPMKRYLLTSIATVVLVMSVAMAAPSQNHAFALVEGQGMEMMLMAEEGSDTIMVSGTVVKSLPTDVIVRVTSPDGLKMVDAAQVTPVDGKFETQFVINPDMWTDNGFYTVTATGAVTSDTSLYKITLPIKVIDGATEDVATTLGNLENMVFDMPDDGPPMAAGITIEATAEIGSDTIMIMGTTDKLGNDITLTVTAPNGNVVTVDQISPTPDGTYESVITTGGPLWTDDGMYTVTATQTDNPEYIASTDVDIEDGVVVPEFGTIAILVFTVAIVSIIVVSARSSRLSIPAVR